MNKQIVALKKVMIKNQKINTFFLSLLFLVMLPNIMFIYFGEDSAVNKREEKFLLSGNNNIETGILFSI